MANRNNHYEAAFEAFLRSRQIPYVAVDEARRSLVEGGSVKSLDFIVASSSGCSWLVDVKGRRFPSGEQKRFWKNWSTRDDLVSLARWEKVFGSGFQALFVFAYVVCGDRAPLPSEQLFEHESSLYGFVGIPLSDYASHARTISPRWNTVAVSTKRFCQLAAPMQSLL